MKKSDLIEQIRRYIDEDLNTDMEPEWIEEIVNIALKAGLQPVTKRTGFTGTAVVNKFEEDITDADWSRAFDDISRE